jgi:hypothetical protein
MNCFVVVKNWILSKIGFCQIGSQNPIDENKSFSITTKHYLHLLSTRELLEVQLENAQCNFLGFSLINHWSSNLAKQLTCRHAHAPDDLRNDTFLENLSSGTGQADQRYPQRRHPRLAFDKRSAPGRSGYRTSSLAEP